MSKSDNVPASSVHIRSDADSEEDTGNDDTRSKLPTFEDDEERQSQGDAMEDEDRGDVDALEYAEDGRPMGQRLGAGRSPSPPESSTLAAVSLPNTVQRFTPSHMARLPLFLRTHPKVFEHDEYKAARIAAMNDEEEAGMDDRLSDVERRMRCENTIRWKVDAQTGQRKSNSRFVRWSDGSWTLQVGKEHFDVAGLDTRHFSAVDSSSNGAEADMAASASQSQSQDQPSQSQTQQTIGASKAAATASQQQQQQQQPTQRYPAQPLTYLATPDYSTGIFQTLSPLYSNVSLQPTSLTSATHRLISQSLSSSRARSAASKVALSELVSGEKAPEEIKRERERKLLEDERKKRYRKRKEKGGDIEAEEEAELMGLLRGRRRTMIDEVRRKSKGSGGGGGSAGRGRQRAAGGASYDDDDEDDEDEDDEGGADEGGYMDEADGFIVDDEEEEEPESGRKAAKEASKKTSKAKRRGGGGGGGGGGDDDDDDDDGDEEEEEEEDMDVDTSDDEQRGGATNAQGEPAELDEMEKAELEIERREAARSKAKKEAAAAAARGGGAGEGPAGATTGDDGAVQRKKKAAVEESDSE